MLIDHKVITVTPSEPEQEFMDALQDGYDILNSTALPDGSITYVLRKRLKDALYNDISMSGGEPFVINGADILKALDNTGKGDR